MVVATSYYNYRNHGAAEVTPLLEKIKAFGKPLIVASNSPYEKFGCPAFADAAIVCFCPSGRENIKAISDVIYGKLKATAKLDVKLTK